MEVHQFYCLNSISPRKWKLTTIVVYTTLPRRVSTPFMDAKPATKQTQYLYVLCLVSDCIMRSNMLSVSISFYVYLLFNDGYLVHLCIPL